MPKTSNSRHQIEQRRMLAELSEEHGAFEDQLSAQVLNWFAAQPKTIQGAILGHYPAEIQADVASIILKQIAKQRAA